MKSLQFICLILTFWIQRVEGTKCSVTAASFENEFCTMKQEIEAVKQFDSRISSAEHELLTLKHTVQKETSDIKDNFDHLQNLTSNFSGGMNGNETAELNTKLDKLMKMFEDVQNRLDHLEVKCKVCNGNGTVINPCSGNPCQNGGRCLVLSHDFQCVCTAGFTGERCQYTDHCTSSPCKNGGTCTSNILGHSCACPTGYTGPFCEIKMNACDSNPCVHGTCILQGSSFKCHCFNGYYGTTCDNTNNSQVTISAKPTTQRVTTIKQTTRPDPCANPSVCNEPARCHALSSSDYECVCPDTPQTKADNCLTPYYYEMFGFCCAKNTCKNDEVVC